MQVITATVPNRKKVYTTTFRSEYFSDVLQAVSEMEACCEYATRKHIEAIDTLIDHDAQDCLYYQMVVTYYTECEKTAAFAARLVEIEAENIAWAAAQSNDDAPVRLKKVTAPKPLVINGIIVENVNFKAPNFTCTVGKFVKHMWNEETEDNMFHWIRCNKVKFPEYANALRLVLGEEHDKLDWHGLDQD